MSIRADCYFPFCIHKKRNLRCNCGTVKKIDASFYDLNYVKRLLAEYPIKEFDLENWEFADLLDYLDVANKNSPLIRLNENKIMDKKLRKNIENEILEELNF